MADDAHDMSPEQKREIFKQRFATLMKDMGQNVHKDGETLYLIGSLAGQLVDKGKAASWSELKMALSQEAYSSLLTTFQAQAADNHQRGNTKVAYAIEILAISTICMTQRDDEQIRAGEQLLDKMIEDTIGLYRKRSGNAGPRLN